MKLVDIEVRIVHETDGAYLVKWDADKDPVWIPKSVAEYDPDDEVLTLPERTAIEKGMV